MNSVMNAMRNNARYGRPDDYVTQIAGKYAALEIDAIKAAAGEILNPKALTWVIVGDREEIEGQIRAANLGDIYFMDEDGNILE